MTLPPNPITMLAMRRDPDKWMRRMQDAEQGETELVNVMAALEPQQLINIADNIADIAEMASADESSTELAVMALCTMEGYRRAMASLAVRAGDYFDSEDTTSA